METWKPINGYEGLYEVSDLGNVRRDGRVLKPQSRRHGYLSVWLYGVGDRRKQFSIHRLVAEAFCENPNNYSEVNHLDENKQNNRADNLEWCSHKQNSSYGSRRAKISEKNTNGKQSKQIAQYTKNGDLVKVFPSLAQANREGFASGNICRCAQGSKSYTHAYGYLWRYV